MARIPVQIARMSAAALAAYTGPQGEMVWNLDTSRIHVQDGVTAGGAPHRLLSDTAAGEVLYTPQVLTPLQRAQGRNNLGTGRFESEAYFNLLINPRQRIQQFNGSGAISATAYLVDGWYLNTTAPIGGTIAVKSSGNFPFPSRPDLDFGLYQQVATAKPNLATTDAAGFQQIVEGIRCQALQFGTAAAKPLLVAFMVRTSFTGRLAASIRNSAADRSYVHEFAVTANVEQFVSFVVPPDTAGTWLTNNGNGLRFLLCTACGAQFQTNQPDTWQSGNFIATPTTSNIFAIANQFVGFGDALILPLSDSTITAAASIDGSRMQLFRRQDEDELLLCMRHYENNTNFDMRAYGTDALTSLYPFKVRKRVAPTISFSNISYANTSAVRVDNATPDSVRIIATISSTGVGELFASVTADSRL